MFQHKLLPRFSIPRITKNGKRHYIVDGDEYPSVTTLVGAYFKHDGLNAWKDRVGHQEAEAIKNRAGLRGTRIHNVCEKYLLNEESPTKGAFPTTIEDFQKVKPVLDKHVREVYGSEFPIFSKKLKVAGTCDLVCSWDGKPAVVDFKTSRKNKKEEWIQNYFCQTAIYAIGINENYKLDIDDVIIILLVDSEYPTIFSKKVKDYENFVNEICILSRPMV